MTISPNFIMIRKRIIIISGGFYLLRKNIKAGV